MAATETTEYKDTITALEQKYIRLLEEKIAGLEASLSAWGVPEEDAEQLDVEDKKQQLTNDQSSVQSDLEKESGGKESEESEKSEGVESDEKDRMEKSRVRYCKASGNRVYAKPTTYTEEEFTKMSKESNSGTWNDSDDEENEDYAIAWKFLEFKDGTSDKPALLIQAKGLRQVLKSVNKGDVIYSWESARVELPYPYELIYHNEGQIREKGSECDETTQKDVEILLEEVNKKLRVERSDAKKLIEQEMITFDLLWALFYYGQIIVKRDVFGKAPQMLAVSTIFRQEERGSEAEEYCLLCQFIDHNGTRYTYAESELTIKHFKNTRRIDELDLVPLSVWAGADGSVKHQDFVEKMTERGKMFEKLCASKAEDRLRQYTGPILSEGGIDMLTDTSFHMADTESVTSSQVDLSKGIKDTKVTTMNRGTRVVIGYKQYTNKRWRLGEEHVNCDPDKICMCISCKNVREDVIGNLPGSSGRGAKLREEQYKFCPPRCFGFALREKQWSQFLVDKIEKLDHSKKEEAFEQLQLDTRSKEILKVLVRQHKTEPNESLSDIIPGKGEGLIVLLHGPPGVGKTLTAESLAILSGKPLYSISMMDVGTSPVVVERNLLTVFQLATHWNALLLFDEADVFLETRSLQDLQRNSLVSVLLRILESFRGILFLTSNRVKTFDEAFQSRINFAVQYKDLEVGHRRAIWNYWINKLGKDNIAHDGETFDEDLRDGGDLITAELNGRQIRNIFRSAAALAQDRKPGDRKLKIGDINKVMKRTLEFQSYMAQTKAMAAKQGIR